MSLLKRLFGDKPAPPGAPASSTFDSVPVVNSSTRSVPKRDVVHVVLRESMRRHGIPADWIECRTLNLVQSNKSTGTYITLIAKGGHDRLLPYVPAFQTSFLEALARFDPRSAEWLRGVAWQFDFGASAGAMPDPGTWAAAAPDVKPSAQASESAKDEDALQADLQALFAIRDAALGDASLAEPFRPTEPGGL